MAKLAYASAYAGFSNEPAIRLAERIVSHAYSNSAAVYFTTGGAESNESAFKFARYHWKRMGKPEKVKIISRVYGYHGVTMAAMSATSLPGYQKMFGPMVPEFVQVPPPYPYRWPGNGDAGIGAADAVEEAILANGADTVAAIICRAGDRRRRRDRAARDVFPSAARDLRPPRRAADRRRGHHRLRPHRPLVRARPLGRGAGPGVVRQGGDVGYVPLGGVIVSKRLHKVIEDAPADEKFMHAATYSGHPTCCAVGLANIEIMENEGLPERAAVMGERLPDGLRDPAQPARGGRRARAGHAGGDRTGGGPGQPQAGDRPGRARGGGVRRSAASSPASAPRATARRPVVIRCAWRRP